VLTAVPRTVPGWTDLAEGALLGRPVPAAPVVDGDVLLPVAVRFRREDGDEWLDGSPVPQDVDGVLALGRLVVEVRLLPALPTRASAAG
jgi:hypothetical protein